MTGQIEFWRKSQKCCCLVTRVCLLPSCYTFVINALTRVSSPPLYTRFIIVFHAIFFYLIILYSSSCYTLILLHMYRHLVTHALASLYTYFILVLLNGPEYEQISDSVVHIYAITFSCLISYGFYMQYRVTFVVRHSWFNLSLFSWAASWSVKVLTSVPHAKEAVLWVTEVRRIH